MHVLGPVAVYPYRETRSLNPPEGLWDDYATTANAIGLARNVVVQPSVYASDNRCTLNAVAQRGSDSVAVVVVNADVTESQLADMHARGARAVRSQMIVAGGTPFDALESIAEKIKPFGWHIEVYLDTQDLPELTDRFRRLRVPIVFDHMGQWLEGDRTDEAGFKVLLEMLGSGQTWVKLSNPRFRPSVARARQLIAANPERVVWGSDWPHISYRGTAPDHAELIDQLADSVPDEASWHRILVTNPQNLYFKRR